MQATICKRFTFHAAHRLPNHDGPCRRLHGHSYVLEVAVTGTVKPAIGDPDEGMVLDFNILRAIYKARIEPLVEHQNLNETLSGMVELTTAENIAAWAHSVFADELEDRAKLPARIVTVRVWETPTSWAEVGDTPWRGR